MGRVDDRGAGELAVDGDQVDASGAVGAGSRDGAGDAVDAGGDLAVGDGAAVAAGLNDAGGLVRIWRELGAQRASGGALTSVPLDAPQGRIDDR
jgi:hypothetical protein